MRHLAKTLKKRGLDSSSCFLRTIGLALYQPEKTCVTRSISSGRHEYRNSIFTSKDVITFGFNLNQSQGIHTGATTAATAAPSATPSSEEDSEKLTEMPKARYQRSSRYESVFFHPVRVVTSF